MGGSFNPPTLAHYRLKKEAIDADFIRMMKKQETVC